MPTFSVTAPRSYSWPIPMPLLALSALNGGSALALAVAAVAPLSPAAPVRLAMICAGVLAVMSALSLAFSDRIGQRGLFAQVAVRLVVTVVLASATVTAGGTLVVCSGFLAMSLWVALFCSGRALVYTFAAEFIAAAVAVALNHSHLRTFGDATAMLTASVFASGLLYHVIGSLRSQACRDQLTGLLNRYGVDQALNERGDLRRAGSASLVAIDLDGLKAVNDRCGHVAGDKVLATVAAELSSATRPVDLAARIGGDEFIVILPGLSASQATRWAREIHSDSSHAWSFGVAERQPGEELMAWLARADKRMYEAKPTTRAGVFAIAANWVPALATTSQAATY